MENTQELIRFMQKKMCKEFKLQREADSYISMSLEFLEKRDYKKALAYAEASYSKSQSIEQRIALLYLIEIAEAQDNTKASKVVATIYQ